MVDELARKSARKSALKSKKTTKRGGKAKPSPSKLSPIPPGFRTVTPYLAIEGAAQAIEFYKKDFGAKELSMQVTMSREEMDAKQKEAMAVFAQSEHPSYAEQPSQV